MLPAFALGALAGVAAAPCALGVPSVAAALRTIAPAFAAGYLCTAGIVELRSLLLIRDDGHHEDCTRASHDALAYGTLAVACAIVALRHGAQLVHPYIAIALAPCALGFAILAWRHRAAAHARLRWAPALMLAGTLLAAPPPAYHATETTLADAFPGERVDFTGVATQTRDVTTIVRFAITCCRADAAPIVVRLARAQPSLHGWVRVLGIIEADRAGLCLRADRVAAVLPPADPFVYR